MGDYRLLEFTPVETGGNDKGKKEPSPYPRGQSMGDYRLLEFTPVETGGNDKGATCGNDKGKKEPSPYPYCLLG